MLKRSSKMKLTLCFVLVVILGTLAVHVESKPIFDHLKRGYEKTVQGLHTLGCKIKTHRGCEDDPEEEDHVHDVHCGHHHNHHDHHGFPDFDPGNGYFNADNDDFNVVTTMRTTSTTIEDVATVRTDDVTAEGEIDIRFGEQAAVTTDPQEGRNVINVGSCSSGYRKDRSGNCRKIV